MCANGNLDVDDVSLWLTDIIEGQYISRRLVWAISTLIFGPVDPTGSFGVIWNCPKGP